MDEAGRWRKRLGGGMRQAGVIAAAGLVAVETMRDRLGEDHDNAAGLAAGLARIDTLALETPDPITNIVYARVEGPRWTNATLVNNLKEEGILCNAVGNDRIRFVTHFGITSDDIDTALAAVPCAVGALPRKS